MTDKTPNHQDQTQPATTGPSLEERIAPLEAMSLDDLRKEWPNWYKSAPPVGFSQDMLGRAIASKMQEKALGGLDAHTRRRLKVLSEKLERDGSITPGDNNTVLRPGTKLVRAWRGKTYRISVLADGFEYDGETYASLSKIANTITGAHWSGPRFFGLNKRSGAPQSAEAGQ
jgi:DUF2924 family protein